VRGPTLSQVPACRHEARDGLTGRSTRLMVPERQRPPAPSSQFGSWTGDPTRQRMTRRLTRLPFDR